MPENFKALLVDQQDGKQTCAIREITNDDLPAGEVTVDVEYSTVNYKDGLAVTGTGKIIRQFPMVPGIDFSGTVAGTGQRVVLNGWGLGERYWGGYSQRARVKSEWMLPLPGNISTQQAMAVGTAGYTAMLCVMALEHQGVKPGDGEVVVTGAAGGVGSVAIAILAKLGYNVVASTGRPETHEYLRSLGATTIIDRATLSEPTKRPMESERWAGAVDTVGGTTLANLIKTMRYDGSIAACGLAGGTGLDTTVFPFILRAVSLIGVDSAYCKMPKRQEAWRRLSTDLPQDKLAEMTQVIGLGDVEQSSKDILAGKVRGRLVVDVNA